MGEMGKPSLKKSGQKILKQKIKIVLHVNKKFSFNKQN